MRLKLGVDEEKCLRTEELIEEMIRFLYSGGEGKDGAKEITSHAQRGVEAVRMAVEKVPKPYSHYDDLPSTSAMLRQKLADRKYTRWNKMEREPPPPPKKYTTIPVWARAIDDQRDEEDKLNDLRNRNLELLCRNRDRFVLEVHRALNCDTTGHPDDNSPEYHEAAQNYAVFGNNLLDFPVNLAKLIPTDTPEPQPQPVPIFPLNLGNGLFPTPYTPPDVQAHFGYAGYHHHPATAHNSAYYHLPNMRQHTCNTSYGMFMGNKVTYVAAAPGTGPMYYNHHSTTTTNFISNSITNAALPAFYFANPTIASNTQYINTFFQKETQFLSAGTAQAATGVYERMVYAHMLQQQIYHQSQQQAAAVAAMYQPKQRPLRSHCPGSSLVTAHPPPGFSVSARQQIVSGGSADNSTKMAPLGKHNKSFADMKSPPSD